MSDLIEKLQCLSSSLYDGTAEFKDYLVVDEAITALESMPAWVKCEERLPEIDYSQPEYLRYVEVIAANENTVRQLRYRSQGFAATEKGRAPRFEELDGRLAYMKPTMWQPMPALPAPPIVEQEG